MGALAMEWGGIGLGVLAGAVLSRFGIPWRRGLLAAGPLGILSYLGWIWQGVGFRNPVSFGLLFAFLAAADGLHPAGRARRSFLLLCALVGSLVVHRGLNRIEGMRALEGLREDVVEDGVVLQTTGFTCAAASAATCLRHLGLPATEREMAELCETDAGGTAPGIQARALDGRLASAGWRVRRGRRTWDALPRDGSPAVLDTTWGTVKHATAFLGFEGDRAVLGEPMQGRVLATREELETRWNWDGGGAFFERD